MSEAKSAEKPTETVKNTGGHGQPAAAASSKLKALVGKLKAALGNGVSALRRVGSDFQKGAEANEVKGRAQQLVYGLGSRDAPTRRMTWFFWLSILAALLTIVAGIGYWAELRKQRLILQQEQEASRKVEEDLERQGRETELKGRVMNLGSFSLELKKVEGQRANQGVMQMADLDIWAVCDTPETCSYIEDHSNEAKNQVTNALTPLDRNELMSRDGKRRIKKAICDRLSKWLGQSRGGQVQQIWFSKMTVL